MAPTRRRPGDAGKEDVTETTLRHWQADLGLTAAAPGSLGRVFALVSCVGALVAWTMGSLFHERESLTWLLFISLVLWQPLVEELLFRGVIQGFLLGTAFGSARRWGLSMANLVTTLAFVLLHFVNQPAIWAIGVVIPSIVFGLFRDRSGSIWPPLALHILFNGAFFAPSFTGT